MRVRKMDADLDMTFGRGQLNFYRDQAEVPAQVALTRMYLFLSEWFLDITDGMPWKTQVLGRYTENTRDPAVRMRILGTPGITGIATYASQEDRNLRSFRVQVAVDTAFGPIVIPPITSDQQNAAAITALGALSNIDLDLSTGTFMG